MTYIPAELRRLVSERVDGCCEYCLVSEADRLIAYEIDHIKSKKHDGGTVADNLAYCCYLCNGYKGSDIASEDPETGEATFLFNPRKQKWSDHFRLNGAIIEPLTPVGRVTVFLLRLNSDKRISERQVLLLVDRYPCPQEP